MQNWLKENFPTFQAISWKGFFKKAIIFIALFILIFIWADNSNFFGYLSEDEAIFLALSAAIVISFIWSRIAKKFNL